MADQVGLTSLASQGPETGEGPFSPDEAARVPRHGKHSVSDPPEIIQRALCVVAALGLLILAEVNFGVGVSSPWRAQISPLGFVLALGLAVAACSVQSERALNWVLLTVFAVAVALTATEAMGEFLYRRGFTTDEGAFVQYGTRLLLRGLNPFTHSLAPGLQLYGPAPVPTTLTNGSISSAYVYPSLPLLLNVPFYWMTNGVQSVSVAAVFFQCVATAVLFVILPGRLRALAVIVVLELPLLFGFEVAGSFYTMLLPFALIAVWRWADIGHTGRLSTGDIARAVCLGLACAVEQIVWIMALFLALGIWRAGSRRLGNAGSARVAARFVLVTLATFALVNLPFILWGAAAWWRDVIAPFTQHAVPLGEGLVELTLILHAGGGNLSWYSDAALALLLALVVTYVVWFRGMWRAGIVLAGVMFFVSTRPLDGYWLEVAPLWLAAVIVPGRAPDPLPLTSWSLRLKSLRIGLTAAVFAPTLAFVGLALSATAPLELRVESVSVQVSLQSIWGISVRATNLTGSPIQPHFALDTIGELTPYWTIDSGPAILHGGQTAFYEISSPSLQNNPEVSAPFVVSAVSAAPDAISTSPVFQAAGRHVELTPNEVDNPVPVGHVVVFHAQIENVSDVPLAIRGIKVALWKVILGEHQTLHSKASVNGLPIIKRVAFARTNAAGVATFRVLDLVPEGTRTAPVYFLSWIVSKHSYNYGYSNPVEVKWYSPPSAPTH
ncbi:MAG TPA: hypothetical protein VED84_07895 [Acidimicrobiales bacterium]|nr:hypothetical protein [Acidimicrobiales bacterium]